MKIGGFQKFSLQDYPKELSAIIFTQGCNFRCPYCHNSELVEPTLYGALIEPESVLRFLYKRRRKLSAVVISGGEPCLQEDLLYFMKILKAMRFKVKLDTNGTLPDVLSNIIFEGAVDYIAMDLKAPLKIYNSLCHSEIDVNKIVRSMEIIRLSGVDYEFRTTFIPEILSWADLFEMQELLQPQDRYYLQECNYSSTLEDLQEYQNENYKIIEQEAYQQYLARSREKRINFALRA